MKRRAIGAGVDDAPTARPKVDLWLAERVLAGWHPNAIVAAAGGPSVLSVRTAYRWRAALEALVEVRLGDVAAIFALRRHQPPIRLTEWAPPGCRQPARFGPGRAIVLPVDLSAIPPSPGALEAAG